MNYVIGWLTCGTKFSFACSPFNLYLGHVLFTEFAPVPLLQRASDGASLAEPPHILPIEVMPESGSKARTGS